MIKKWKEISRKLVFDNWRKIEKVTYKMPDGRIEDFHLKKDGAYCAALAFTKDKKIILAKQFRPGPNEILLELPGGLIEKGATPKTAMEKELLEETGYKGNLKLITSCFADGYSDNVRYYFVARECEKISDQKLDQSEFIEVVLVSLKEFRKLLRSGKMSDVQGGYLCLDYLELL